MKTPIGIAWRNGYVRMCSDCFDKSYLISEMKRNPNNIVPVIVVDIITKKSKCYLINDSITDFEIVNENQTTCRKINGIANYMINKKNIQKSQLTAKEKEDCCDLNDRKHYKKQKLELNKESIFKTLLTKANMTESK